MTSIIDKSISNFLANKDFKEESNKPYSDKLSGRLLKTVNITKIHPEVNCYGWIRNRLISTFQSSCLYNIEDYA